MTIQSCQHAVWIINTCFLSLYSWRIHFLPVAQNHFIEKPSTPICGKTLNSFYGSLYLKRKYFDVPEFKLFVLGFFFFSLPTCILSGVYTLGFHRVPRDIDRFFSKVIRFSLFPLEAREFFLGCTTIIGLPLTWFSYEKICLEHEACSSHP